MWLIIFCHMSSWLPLVLLLGVSSHVGGPVSLSVQHKFVKIVASDDVICNDTKVEVNVTAEVTVIGSRSMVQCCKQCAEAKFRPLRCYAVRYPIEKSRCAMIFTDGYKMKSTGNVRCNLTEIVLKKESIRIENITIINQLAPVINQWIVIQQRVDDSVDFKRNWSEYRKGFGDLTTNFWLGLEAMHKLTVSNPTLRLEVQSEGAWYFDMYKDFRVASEVNGYSIHVGGYYGNNGDVITKGYAAGMDMQDMKFSTSDCDNDPLKGTSCADDGGGGWWYQKCFSINLNGPYGDPTKFRYFLPKAKRLVSITTCRMMISLV